MTTEPPLAIDDWGRVDYADALDRQRTLNLAVSTGDAPDTLVFVEHPAVITISHRKNARDHLLATDADLKELGITVEQTDRGGDITYHGPGQLVAYPILKLNRYHLNLSRYMRLLEQAVINTAQTFGINATRDACATGVWAETKTAENSRLAKLCALGVRVRKNTTMHGLALNVTTDLDHFFTIDPCGLGHRPVTSLQALLEKSCPSMAGTKAELARQLDAQLQAAISQQP